MRWLLIKDLQILRRSKLLVGLLVAYPIAIALLIGFALSGGPKKPRIAFVDQIPAKEAQIDIGGQKLDLRQYTKQLFKGVDQVPVKTRAEAIDKLKSGDALAAVIIPPDFAKRLQNAGFSLAPTVEVIYNGDALKQSFVRTTIKAQLAEANAALSNELNKVAGRYLNIVARGGDIAVGALVFHLLGIYQSKQNIDRVLADSPSAATRRTLKPVQNFMAIGVANFGRFKDVLESVRRPVQVKETVSAGNRAALDTFAVALAISVSLMFVCVLLASGLVALEREENTFARLARGLVRPTRLIVAKIVLAAACAAAVTLVMLAGISAFVPLDWGRAGQWVVAIAAGALGFAALGVAIGGLARDVRAASLLAFLLSLPLVFLALVPSGAVSPALYDVVRVISAVFPFKAALDAINAAINNSSPGLGEALAHLAALIVVFGAAARYGLRRLV
jgi:ABC-2 type transport system permease protein